MEGIIYYTEECLIKKTTNWTRQQNENEPIVSDIGSFERSYLAIDNYFFDEGFTYIYHKDGVKEEFEVISITETTLTVRDSMRRTYMLEIESCFRGQFVTLPLYGNLYAINKKENE